MTSCQDEPPQPPYSPADLNQIAKLLGISKLSVEHTSQLQHAALTYLFLDATEPKPGARKNSWRLLPSRSARRKALQRVAKTARALKAALEDQALIFLEEREKKLLSAPECLDQLVILADREAEQIPKGGPDPKLARLVFIRRLAEIYEDITQRPARRHHDPMSGLDSGPFLEFTKAAFKPVNKGALKGLEHVVRQVDEERSSK